MNFGTALFRTVTTGTAYQVVSSITGEPPSILTTKKYTSASAYATAELDLDGTFSAWKANLRGTGTTTLNGFDQILISKASASDNRLMPIITANGAALTTSFAYSNTTSVPTGTTIETNYAKAVSTATSKVTTGIPTGSYTYNASNLSYSFVGTSNGYQTKELSTINVNYYMSVGIYTYYLPNLWYWQLYPVFRRCLYLIDGKKFTTTESGYYTGSPGALRIYNFDFHDNYRYKLYRLIHLKQ